MAISTLRGMTPQEIVARTLMGEAGQEGEQGMLAAAAVMDNRRKSGGYGGDTFHDVILKPGQFSLYNGLTGYAGGEGANTAWQGDISPMAWEIAGKVTSGQYDDPTGGATHYFNPNTADPSWARGKSFQDIGNHRFLNADAGRSAGNPAAYTPSSPMSGGGGSTSLMGGQGNDTLSTKGGQQMAQPPMTFGQGLRNAAQSGALWDGLAQAFNSMSRRPNAALGAAINQRQSDRRKTGATAAQQNRTAEWLRSNGMEREAAMVESGVLTGPQLGALLTKRNERKPIEVNGQLIDPDTYEVIGDFRTKDTGADLPTKEDANGVLRFINPGHELHGQPVFDNTGAAPADVKGESDLRKEYTGDQATKDFKDTAAAYGRVRASAADPSPAGDMALIFNYMKLLDPGSVVREGEFKTVADAGAWLTKKTEDGYAIPRPVANAIERAQTGNLIQDDVRSDLLTRSDLLYSDAVRQNEKFRDTYTGIADQYGYDTGRVVPDFGYIGDPAVERSPRAPRRPEGLDTTQVPSQPQRRYTEAQILQGMGKLTAHDRELLSSLPDPAARVRFLQDKGVLQ